MYWFENLLQKEDLLFYGYFIKVIYFALYLLEIQLKPTNR